MSSKVYLQEERSLHLVFARERGYKHVAPERGEGVGLEANHLPSCPNFPSYLQAMLTDEHTTFKLEITE